MSREFQEEFMHTLGELMKMCADCNTDTIELGFDTNGTKWSVEMIFKIDEDGEQHD